jgi:FO synthase
MTAAADISGALRVVETGGRMEPAEAFALADFGDVSRLIALAEQMCLVGHGTQVSFSKKVFIPLTKLCRDVCHYCTFAQRPRQGEPAFLSPDAVLEIARAGRAAGCKEALFTLGDRPERRYGAARDGLTTLGFDSTLAYLESAAALVLKETGLLPHLNPGVMEEAWLVRLRKVSVSQGMMLETASERLSQRGGPHFGSPDKHPSVRLAMLEAAGRAGVPFTTGILIGIGETRVERIEALLAIRDAHERHGHIQEVIIQNFRAKPGTRMAGAPEPTLEDHVWTIAVARLVLGPAMNIQAPPNLQPEGLAALLRAGINDWGGVSPVTPDHVNPEAPWPHLSDLERATEAAGRTLVERLAIYPEFVGDALRAFPPPGGGRLERHGLSSPISLLATGADGQAKSDGVPGGGGIGARTPPPGAPRSLGPAGAFVGRADLAGLSDGAPPSALKGEVRSWLDPALHTPTLRLIDAAGLAREDAWSPGGLESMPAAQVARVRANATPSRPIAAILDRLASGGRLDESDIVALFAARGQDVSAVCRAADALRARRCGDIVTYVVNRNINYTNICTYGCTFCAFSKGRHSLGHREKPYDLALEEIATRTREAWARGATEVCLQGGIRPGYTGETYLSIVAAVKSAAPDMHVHAFSPLEIWHGAETLGLPLGDYLTRLKEAGLASLPGTAAEILDDEVRAILCPDKIDTAQWLQVMSTAHAVGLRSTATIMFGHVDGYGHWARHLLRVRELQERTGGFTEFVPLPFVHMEAPIYLKGRARKGPTLREAMLMHAVARLVLEPVISNIQASWVKMGPDGAALCLSAGANDMGGVLMNESITRAAGAAHGQELHAEEMNRIIRASGRQPRQRSTLYGPVSAERIHAAGQGGRTALVFRKRDWSAQFPVDRGSAA